MAGESDNMYERVWYSKLFAMYARTDRNFKNVQVNPGALINSCSEIYGACRHRAGFHRYCQVCSTDDGEYPERVAPARASLTATRVRFEDQVADV